MHNHLFIYAIALRITGKFSQIGVISEQTGYTTWSSEDRCLTPNPNPDPAEGRSREGSTNSQNWEGHICVE